MFDREKYNISLKTERFGREMIVVEEVASTNLAVMDMVATDAQEGMVMVTDRQTEGKGRFERKWVSPSGGLWFSFLLRPDIREVPLPAILLLTGVALVKVLQEKTELQFHLGWPNDVVHKGKKLAGILVEGKIGASAAVVVGIGVNVNNDPDDLTPEFASKATSLKKITGKEHSLEILLAEFMNEFERGYSELREMGSEKLYHEWKMLLGMIGQEVKLLSDEKEYHGIVKDFTMGGEMILRLEDGEEVLFPLDRGTLISPKYTKKL